MPPIKRDPLTRNRGTEFAITTCPDRVPLEIETTRMVFPSRVSESSAIGPWPAVDTGKGTIPSSRRSQIVAIFLVPPLGRYSIRKCGGSVVVLERNKTRLVMRWGSKNTQELQDYLVRARFQEFFLESPIPRKTGNG